MPAAPLFSAGLLVSRRGSAPGRLRRAAAVIGAAALHALLVAGAIGAPILCLEMLPPPRAGVADSPVVFPPLSPSRRPGGDGLRASLGRGGGASGRRAENPHPARTRPPAPTRIVPALAPPADESRAASIAPAPDAAAPLPDNGRGGTGVGGDGTGGSPTGCPGCVGTGEWIGDGPPGGGILDESDPRIVLAVPIPGARILPKYPDLARRARLEGSVVLLITIGADGTVGEIEVLRSPDPRWGFDLAAIEAVRKWRYRPALLDGRPVAIQARVLVEFALAR